MGQGTFVTKPISQNHKGKTLRLPFDVPLLLIVVILLVIGLLMVFSASWDLSIYMGEEPTYLFSRQILWVFLGLITATVASLIDYHFYRKIIVPAGILTWLALIGVLIVNETAGTATARMLVGNSIQPSELAKAVLIMYCLLYTSPSPRD
mgnify:CR=1 FL=1